MPLDIRLLKELREPLELRQSCNGKLVCLRSEGLNSSVVTRWLSRQGIPVSNLSPEPSLSTAHDVPLIRLPTLVVSADPRVQNLAELYAQSVGARLLVAQDANHAAAEAEAVSRCQSVTIMLLSNSFSELWSQALVKANSNRKELGRTELRYGFLSALTPDYLAWLIVKTWVLLLREQPDSIGLGRFDFAEPVGVTCHFRSPATGESRTVGVRNPWSSDEIDVLALRGHGASFDANMNRVVLCGHIDPVLPRTRTRRAPSCFHDGVCFRMERADAPEERLLAVHATPLVWCMDSCAAIPFAENAFGDGTSYAFGLLAGAAVGVIGPFLDVMTSGSLTRVFEAFVATGSSLGEAVAATNKLEPAIGFDKFLLLGSPDIHLTQPYLVQPEFDGHRLRYPLRGLQQMVWRLTVPTQASAPLHFVLDDGDPLWKGAHYYLFENSDQRTVVLFFDEPHDVNGWVVIGPSDQSWAQMYNEAERDALRFVALYEHSFFDTACDDLEQCRSILRSLQEVLSHRWRMRQRMEATLLIAALNTSINRLYAQASRDFIACVSSRDFSLDREFPIGFRPSVTKCIDDQCPSCRATLYRTIAAWHENTSYRRILTQCPNCAGISMVVEGSPLKIVPPTAVVGNDQKCLEIALELINISSTPVRAMVSGIARRAPSTEAFGPVLVTIAAESRHEMTLLCPLNIKAPGVVSYRVVVLHSALGEFFALRYALEPSNEAELSLAPAI